MQAAKQRRQSNRLISNIDTIGFASGMLAVLFVLLLFFMTMNPHAGIDRHDVDLAKVRHPVPMPGANREDAIIITIAKDAKVYFGRGEVVPSQIPAKIQAAVQSGSPKIVYFKVDARARYRSVSPVLDSVRSYGLEKIEFLTLEQKGAS